MTLLRPLLEPIAEKVRDMVLLSYRCEKCRQVFQLTMADLYIVSDGKAKVAQVEEGS